MMSNKFRLFLGVIAVLILLVIVVFLINKRSAAESNREEISIVLNNIIQNAQTHYKRTSSFTGWTIPQSLRIDKIGTFKEKVEPDKITIYVVGKELGKNGVSNVNLAAIITGSKTAVQIRN